MIRRVYESVLLLVILGGAICVTLLDSVFRKRTSTTAPEEDPPDGSEAEAGRFGLKRWLVTAAAIVGVLGVGGALVAVSGIVPIKASSGHWWITSWFLNFSKERSVATHTLRIRPPALDEEWLVLKGAGHYETACRPCHGSPGIPQPRVALRMTPRPPNLQVRVPKWDPEELFYIVKHGIKFTGMPAWAAPDRDDEVWAMVAFLRRLPGMDLREYRLLAIGEMPHGEGAPIEDLLPPEKMPHAVVESCGRCHGADGLGRGRGAFPKLAGQKPDYLYQSLVAYAQGRRRSGIMEPIAAGLSNEGMRELALYYAHLPATAPAESPARDVEAIERGRVLAQEGIPGRKVPACAACHGPGEEPRNPTYPTLTGQYDKYLALQLQLFSGKGRGGTAYAHLMRHAARGLQPEHIRDLAAYYASLAPPALDLARED